MFSWLARAFSACLRPVRQYARMSKDDNDDGSDSPSTVDDALVWFRDLEKHSGGEFSFAVVQANEVLEDHSQVETGSDGVFVGVYDGHGGPEASRFINDHLFRHLMSESCFGCFSNSICFLCCLSKFLRKLIWMNLILIIIEFGMK